MRKKEKVGLNLNRLKKYNMHTIDAPNPKPLSIIVSYPLNSKDLFGIVFERFKSAFNT
jgi:hypothetical protein